jgi:hypothetical protein
MEDETVWKTISFAEVVQDRDTTVRVTDDGMIYAIDLAVAMTGKDRNDAGQILRRLGDDVFERKKICSRTFGGGGFPTKLVSLSNAIELVMVLPGKVAKETRTQFANIIRRYLAGDPSLAQELHTNAQSSSPAALLAKASINLCTGEETEPLLSFKRKREELKIQRMEQNLASQMQANITNLTVDYDRICTNTTMDERAKLMFKDCYLNIILNTHRCSPQKQTPALENGNQPTLSLNKPVSISSVAAELGYKPTSTDAKRIGMDLKKLYTGKYNKPPPKHDQLCDGRVTNVNSYTEQDRPLVIQALHEYFKSHHTTKNGASA